MTTTLATMLSIILAGAAGTPSQSAIDTVRGRSSAPVSLGERASRSVDVQSESATSPVGRTLRDMMRARLVLEGSAVESPVTTNALGLVAMHDVRLTDVVSDVP